jgi:hypothetical protein
MTGVVAAHNAFAGDHMGMGTAACLAVVDTAAMAAGLALAARVRRRPVVFGASCAVAAPVSLARPLPRPRARPGPDVLQVFRR